MECQKKKIQDFSNIIHALITFVMAITVVLLSMRLFARVWEWFNLPVDIVTIGEHSLAMPQLLSIGGTNIFIPAITDFGGVGVMGDLRAVVMVITLLIAKRLFKALKNTGMPFSEEVITEFKRFSIALIIAGMNFNVFFTTLALIVFAFSYVLDYGRLLQIENDTTL